MRHFSENKHDEDGLKYGAVERVWVNHTSGLECQQKIDGLVDEIIRQLGTARDRQHCLINIFQDIQEKDSIVAIAVFLMNEPCNDNFMDGINKTSRAIQFTKTSEPHVSVPQKYRLNLVSDAQINRILKHWQGM